jgi:hypothetical protein
MTLYNLVPKSYRKIVRTSKNDTLDVIHIHDLSPYVIHIHDLSPYVIHIYDLSPYVIHIHDL